MKKEILGLNVPKYPNDEQLSPHSQLCAKKSDLGLNPNCRCESR